MEEDQLLFGNVFVMNFFYIFPNFKAIIEYESIYEFIKGEIVIVDNFFGPLSLVCGN